MSKTKIDKDRIAVISIQKLCALMGVNTYERAKVWNAVRDGTYSILTPELKKKLIEQSKKVHEAFCIALK